MGDPGATATTGHAPSVTQRRRDGARLRSVCPRSSHADWTPGRARPDPVAVVRAQDASRLPWLVPLRHERLRASPFAFLRGSAAVMAADLAGTPSSGIHVQLCGDAHLANFGLFGTPERNLVFDVNDFDETLRGPWEWDLKRLAASVVVAARSNGLDEDDGRYAARGAVDAYAAAMRALAERSLVEVWYAQLRLADLEQLLAREHGSRKDRRRFERGAARVQARARRRDSAHAAAKLTSVVDGRRQFRSDPPEVVPLAELADVSDPEVLRSAVVSAFEGYRASLPDARRFLLDRYVVRDLALKVVGVGSVGTRCILALFEGRTTGDPLILQVKEANRSVLANHLPGSPYENQGRRVVEGQRLLQAASDIFLGWSGATSGRDYYWRQFRDMKLSAAIESYGRRRLAAYARVCGLALAHGHARTGDPAGIAGYIGSSDTFAAAVTDFASAYADQTERDHAALVAAGPVEPSPA